MPSLMTNGSSTIYAEIEDKLKKSIKLDNKSNELHQTKLFTTPQKRRLRSNSMPDDPISSLPKHFSPPVCKSPRRCMNSSPNGNSLEICNGSDEKVWKSPKLPKSPRVCINSSPNGKRIGIGHGSDTRIGKSPRKKLSDSFTEKPKWNPKDREQIGAVKEALHVSMAPSEVVCREEEQKRVLEFCKDSIQKEKGGSLYLCGCPGTGKTLSMEKVKQSLLGWVQEEGFHSPSILAMNCTSLPSTSDVFTKILEMYPPRKKINGASSALQHLKKLFSQKQSSSGKMTLIIADELDYLITKDRSVLHDLFMLTTFPFSTCILIGIANAIDLADRFLPKLKALNCKPMIITFRAYSIDQILRILHQRLKALPYDVFHPKALEFCARKVAAASGDMRKVLCVCRSAIEMLEAELRDIDKEMSLMQPANVPSTQSPPPATECSTKKIIDIVNIDHMALALSQTFKSAVVDTIQALPQHQQVILCSMVKLFRRDKKDTTIGELNKSYCEICKLTQVPQASFLEFSNMCRVLSDQGLLKIGQAKEDRLKRVTLKIDEADIKFALQGIRFFRTCLQ